jgi:CRP-like cAMP-binding protein
MRVLRFDPNPPGPPEELILQVPAGQEIFAEAEAGDDMYFVRSGSVEIGKDGLSGPRPVGVLEKGEFFGELSVLEGSVRPHSARALADCELLRINRRTLERLLLSHPEIALGMLQSLSRRLKEALRLAVERGDPASSGSLRRADTATLALVKPAAPRSDPPPDYDELFLRAMRAYLARELDLALELFARCQAARPDDVRARYNMERLRRLDGARRERA